MKEGAKLHEGFYLQSDVTLIARELIGKLLVTNINGQLTSGFITETEAYNGVIDKASHAYGNRRTNRTETMYKSGGRAYIYLCYGIHSLFNVVTNETGTPHAVLIRSILPYYGIPIMEERAGRKVTEKEGIGPGRVSKILGINFKQDGTDLVSGNLIWVEDHNILIDPMEISCTPRIGVGYAQEDALLKYRFVIDYKLMRNKVG